MDMYTDPNHVRVEDPGKVEGNPVFTYLRAFDADTSAVHELEQHYERGGLGDVVVKRRLIDVLNAALEPMRERRARFSKDDALTIAREGTSRARQVTGATLARVKQAMHITYFS